MPIHRNVQRIPNRNASIPSSILATYDAVIASCAAVDFYTQDNATPYEERTEMETE
jgi:hypothetical protein